MNTFTSENGILLDKNNEMLHIVKGDASSVEFSSQLILDFHKQSPGIVACLSHTHPRYMNQMSPQDEVTLRTLAKALHPFPICMEVIAETLTKEEQFAVPYLLFSITRWFAQLESKESWEQRKKTTPREVTIVQIAQAEEVFFLDSSQNEYWDLLIRKSYHISE